MSGSWVVASAEAALCGGSAQLQRCHPRNDFPASAWHLHGDSATHVLTGNRRCSGRQEHRSGACRDIENLDPTETLRGDWCETWMKRIATFSAVAVLDVGSALLAAACSKR